MERLEGNEDRIRTLEECKRAIKELQEENVRLSRALRSIMRATSRGEAIATAMNTICRKPA